MKWDMEDLSKAFAVHSQKSDLQAAMSTYIEDKLKPKGK
jgi:hypothetical protein